MYQLVHGNRFSAFTENVSMRGECICGSQPSTSFALLFAPPKLGSECSTCQNASRDVTAGVPERTRR